MENKVLVFDIETRPMLAYVWGLKDQNISLNQIKEDWQIMAWGAKWLNEKKVMYMDTRHDKNDRRILEHLWKLLDEADIVITQNGKGFDSPKLNARFIEYGMQPPSPYKHLDTYLIVRNAAQFTSNKLEYLTNKLCTKYKKLSHAKFPGMSLWTECLNGNMKAWDEMREYNEHDVLSTEEFYNKIKAWAPQNAPKLYNLDHSSRQCCICGVKDDIEFRGNKKTGRSVHCWACGKWDIWPKEKVLK